jgi:hypothetical protein
LSDWIAMVGILSTAGVAISTHVIAAAMRRGDRNHEAALEYEKRAWEAKNTALIDLIAKSSELRRACQSERGAGQRTHQELVDLLWAYDDVRDGFTQPALLAYASEPVRSLVEELAAILSPLYQRDSWFQLETVRDIRKAQKAKEAAIEAQDFEQAAAMRDSEKRAWRSFKAEELDIDLDTVEALCTKILMTARNDLRGK